MPSEKRIPAAAVRAAQAKRAALAPPAVPATVDASSLRLRLYRLLFSRPAPPPPPSR